ncbi:alpha-amylase [Peribacillus kribbensis]|uniref:alpha-amylase n=1 Tax=Peribacillus kribbensis TaxID=356658 RepID=UPI000402D248|nr:alpha-amylase [Peribacillus kribbensis]
MKRNSTLMQFFEWHVNADGNHWKRLKEQVPELKKIGIDSIWVPPVTKGLSADDNGYGIYDGYDLGEFDQKGTVRTKYGTKDELIDAVFTCRDLGLNVYVDVVMNHKAGADETELFQVVEVNPLNRNEDLSEPFEIEGWTKFTFPGRNGRYSEFQWSFVHFNGTDYDAKTGKTGVFKILGENKDWNEHVDNEFGNYDYLMFANIDYDHPDVIKEMFHWGRWLSTEVGCNGYRLDAIKHINQKFISTFVKEVRNHKGDDFYFVGEFWNPDLNECRKYLDEIDYQIDLFDVPLHYKLHEASKAGRDFNMASIFDDTIVHSHPLNAVTFVDNHDTQPREALESWVEDWFKPIAYSLILLREGGYPCVFYGDYYGIGGEEPIPGKKEEIEMLLSARYHKAYGQQDDYFDHPNTIGWVRRGTEEIEKSGCAVVVSNGDDGEKKMYVGTHRSGEEWSDLTYNCEGTIKIDEEGFAVFPVKAGSVSVWALK